MHQWLILSYEMTLQRFQTKNLQINISTRKDIHKFIHLRLFYWSLLPDIHKLEIQLQEKSFIEKTGRINPPTLNDLPIIVQFNRPPLSLSDQTSVEGNTI